MHSINISDFNARCLAILEEISRTGEGVTILERGKPIAQVVSLTPRQNTYPQDELKGTVEILGDIVSPVVPSSN